MDTLSNEISDEMQYISPDLIVRAAPGVGVIAPSGHWAIR